jgi:hypothetical protein
MKLIGGNWPIAPIDTGVTDSKLDTRMPRMITWTTKMTKTVVDQLNGGGGRSIKHFLNSF